MSTAKKQRIEELTVDAASLPAPALMDAPMMSAKASGVKLLRVQFRPGNKAHIANLTDMEAH